jgi:hypothetical protein
METEDDPRTVHRKHIDRIDKTIVALEAERERLTRILAANDDELPEVSHGC